MLLNYLATVKLDDEPGKEFVYSSMGMALLGIILEEVYQTSFENLIKEKILAPYYLESTGITLTEEQNKKFTTGYNQNGAETPHWQMGIFAPAGAIKSCTSDMLNYLELNRKEAEKPFVMVHLPTYKGNETVGLAWFIKKTKQGNYMTWHNGATYGSGSFCAFIQEKECSVIILTNSETSVDFLGIAILNYLQK
jgi:CubicO group peptidase (beta-lactamase class C family)